MVVREVWLCVVVGVGKVAALGEDAQTSCRGEAKTRDRVNDRQALSEIRELQLSLYTPCFHNRDTPPFKGLHPSTHHPGRQQHGTRSSNRHYRKCILSTLTISANSPG